ncbi:MAG: hypothetical protein WBD60_03300, partial [Methylovirgula sp.]
MRSGRASTRSTIWLTVWLSIGRPVVGEFDHGDPVGQLQGRLEAFREPRRGVRPHDDPVHDDVDVVLDLLVERRR